MDLGERARPCRSRLKPGGNVRVDQVGEDIGLRHLERLSATIGHRIHLLTDATRPPETVGAQRSAAIVWAYLDAIDGTVKVAGIGSRTPPGRLRAANDGGWAIAMAFTAPTAKPFETLLIGDFVAAAIVDGNPTRHKTYPPEVMAVPGPGGLEAYDVSDGGASRVFTSSNEQLADAMVYLDGFQAFDRDTSRPGDEALAVELYRRLINRNEPGGAYDVLRQYSNLNALQRTMLGWRNEPVWYESQGVAFIAMNENLTNLIPAVPIIEGAGGRCLDFDGRPLRERLLTRGRTNVFHAANGAVAERVLEVIRAARGSVGGA